MRLSSEQVTAIKQETGHCFGARAEGGLFARRMKVQRGFTLVELITVMVIVGIISVAALPRFFDNDVFQARGAADQVKSALRYGQKVAIAQRRAVDVNLSSAASVDCSTVLVVSNVSCAISNSVTVAPALPQTVTFNALGQRTSATGSFTVGSATITIEAETGYVH